MIFTVIVAMVLATLSASWRGAALAPLPAFFLTCLFAALPPAAAFAAFVHFARRARAVRSQGGPLAFEELVRLSGRLRRAERLLEGLTVAAYAAALFAGWNAVPDAAGLGGWALPTGALLFAPFIVSLFFVWAVLHFAEIFVRGAGPTLAQRLSFRLRHNVLTVSVPIGIILGLYDLFDLLPRSFKAPLELPWVSGPLTLILILGGYAAAPMVIVRVWKTSRLPDGPTRRRLHDLCRRLGVGYRDIRVWETPGHFFANAAVMGIAPFARYIIVSRSLLEAMPVEEVEAVFAHELGHAKRHHMIFYLILAGDFMLLAYIFEMISGAAVETETAYLVVWVIVFALYWGGGFGYVSRAFERDADLFGAQAVEDYRTFALALRRIARMNAVSPEARSWRHGSIASRVKFLEEAALSPEVRQRFLNRLAFIRTFLVSLAAVAALAAALLEGLR